MLKSLPVPKLALILSVCIVGFENDTLSLPFFADEKDEFTTFPAGKTLTYYIIKTQEPLFATKEILKKLERSFSTKKSNGF